MSTKYSIKLNVTRESTIKDPAASRFFGVPFVPESMADDYIDDFFYLAQIRLSDIADLDTDNILPHKGYLYLVVDAEMYPSDTLCIYANYTDEEPDTPLFGLNSQSQVSITDDISYAITFSKAAPDEDCTRLFGLPSGKKETEGELLLQYKPSDFKDVPFFEELEGYIYVTYIDDDVFDTDFAVDRLPRPEELNGYFTEADYDPWKWKEYIYGKHSLGGKKLDSGDDYNGQLDPDLNCSGVGRVKTASGSYIGEWKNDKRCGRGTERRDGYLYIGEWDNDKPNGNGTEITFRKAGMDHIIIDEVFTGEFADGKRKGN